MENNKVRELYHISICSRTKGNTEKYIQALKEEIEKNGQVIVSTTDAMLVKRTWRRLKNKGCNCKYDPIYGGAGNKLETVYDNICEPLFVFAPEKKLTGYMFYNSTPNGTTNE